MQPTPALYQPGILDGIPALARYVLFEMAGEQQPAQAIREALMRLSPLANGSDVRMSGIKIGSVVAQSLDPQTYRAIVRLSVDSAIKLPEDTTARIQSDGLLGNTYMVLEPGGAEEMIPPGGKIRYTQSSVSLENLIGKLIFSAPAGKPETGAPPPPETPAPVR